MSVEIYDKMIGVAEINSAISSSEAEVVAGGELKNARDARGELRRKHFE